MTKGKTYRNVDRTTVRAGGKWVPQGGLVVLKGIKAFEAQLIRAGKLVAHDENEET